MKLILALYLTISTGYLFYSIIDIHNMHVGDFWKFIGLTFVNMLITTVMRDVIQGEKGDK